MRFLGQLVFLCCVFLSREAYSSVGFVGFGYGIRPEKDTSGQSYQTRNPLQIFFGYEEDNWEAIFEYSQNRAVESTPVISINNGHQEYLLASRNYPFGREYYYLPYVTAGIGAAQDVVETRFLEEWKTHYSQLNWFPMLGIGLWGPVLGPVELGVEIRVKYSDSFDPKFTPEVSARVGVEF